MPEVIVATTQYYYPVIFSSFTLAPLALLMLPISIVMLALSLEFLVLGCEGKKMAVTIFEFYQQIIE